MPERIWLVVAVVRKRIVGSEWMLLISREVVKASRRGVAIPKTLNFWNAMTMAARTPPRVRARSY